MPAAELGVAVPQSPNPWLMGAKAPACAFQPKKVGTKATEMPRDFSCASTPVHQSAELAPALNAETTSRPSSSRYAAGLGATAAMILTTVSASDFRAEISGMTMILKRGSTP